MKLTITDMIICDVQRYQTGVDFVLLGQDDLWRVRHDVEVGLVLLPGGRVCFLQTAHEHGLVRMDL